MLDNPAAIRSLRTWRRRVIATAMAICVGLAIITLRARPPLVTLVEACRVEALRPRSDAGAQLRIGGVCLVAFGWTHDAASGARAARALARASGHRWLVEWLASAIGDRADGADAWLAAGWARMESDEAEGAVAAFERARAHRATSDVAGRIHDANSLISAYRALGDLERATQAAADAYTLSAAGATAERSMTLINLADLLRELGSLEITRRLLGDAAAITGPDAPGYAVLQQTQGLVEQALHHPIMARTALRAARAAAIQQGTGEWTIYLGLLDLAIEEGDLADASELVAHAPPIPSCANDRAAAAYYLARLEVAQGRFAAAARRSELALRQAPRGWARHLEAVRGYALLRDGATDAAEQALLRSVRGLEEQRSELDNDTLKSWSLAQRRTAFEDLFLLYAKQGRLADALHIVQRATARSLLDGLLAEPALTGTIQTDIVAAGTHAAGLRALARSLRTTPSAEVPAIASILRRLRGRHIVTYFRARDDLWAIAIRRDSTLVARRIGNADELGRTLDGRGRAEGQRGSVDAGRAHAAPEDVAEQLGMRLLPDELAPAAGETLYVIADGPVREVTFASLRRHGAYVVERNPVAYGLSAAALSVARPATGTSPAVVIGDPLGDLPSARLEAIDVAHLLEVKPYVGGDATRAVLRSAGAAVLLHIAAHTDPTANGPAIHLADATVEAATVVERQITTRLVVLLGCSSARAKERDELAPLAAAFLAAGAHTVVASLWAVDDTLARRFAREFYLADGIQDPIRALAVAQRKLMNEGARVDQWSTFVVLGGPGDAL